MPDRESRGLTSIDGANALIGVLVIVQMWTLTSALEAYLAGHHDAALPAAVFSGLLFAACVALYRFLRRVDADVRRDDRPR